MKRAWLWGIGLLLAVVFFAVNEALAFVYPNDFTTLSYAVSYIGAKWPPFIWFCGHITGLLTAHFFWAWKANPMGPGAG